VATIECPNCHRAVEGAEPRFCSYCGTELGVSRHKPGETASEPARPESPVVNPALDDTLSWVQAAFAAVPTDLLTGGQARVKVSPMEIILTPGRSVASLHVDVFNASDIVDEFWAGALQAPGWLGGKPGVISLFPGEQGVIQLSLDIPEGQIVPAGTYPLTIRAVSRATRKIVQDEQIQLKVLPMPGPVAPTLSLEPQEVRGVSSADLTIDVSHSGNTSVNVEFSAEDAQRVLSFRFAPARVTVPPAGGARTVCSISATPSRFGQEVDHRFTVHARGFQQPLQASGVFHQSPVVKPGRARFLRIAMLSLVGVAVLLAAVLFLPKAFTSSTGPRVIGVEPISGPIEGGNSVVITGSGFTKDAKVFFDTTRATVLDVSSAGKEMTVEAPAHGRGTVDVRVSTIDGDSQPSVAAKYSYGQYLPLPSDTLLGP
jgi:hypothetical protein